MKTNYDYSEITKLERNSFGLDFSIASKDKLIIGGGNVCSLSYDKNDQKAILNLSSGIEIIFEKIKEGDFNKILDHLNTHEYNRVVPETNKALRD